MHMGTGGFHKTTFNQRILPQNPKSIRENNLKLLLINCKNELLSKGAALFILTLGCMVHMKSNAHDPVTSADLSPVSRGKKLALRGGVIVSYYKDQMRSEGASWFLAKLLSHSSKMSHVLAQRCLFKYVVKHLNVYTSSYI